MLNRFIHIRLRRWNEKLTKIEFLNVSARFVAIECCQIKTWDFAKSALETILQHLFIRKNLIAVSKPSQNFFSIKHKISMKNGQQPINHFFSFVECVDVQVAKQYDDGLGLGYQDMSDNMSRCSNLQSGGRMCQKEPAVEPILGISV